MDTGTFHNVHHGVKDEATDRRLLHPMARALDSLGLGALTAVADRGFDRGFDSGEHASAWARDGITACVPAQRAVNNQGDGTLFDRTARVFKPGTDTHLCPGGRRLARRERNRKARALYLGGKTA